MKKTLEIPEGKIINPVDYIKIKIDSAFEILSKLNATNSKIKNYALLSRIEREDANETKDELMRQLKIYMHTLEETIKELDKVVY